MFTESDMAEYAKGRDTAESEAAQKRRAIACQRLAGLAKLGAHGSAATRKVAILVRTIPMIEMNRSFRG